MVTMAAPTDSPVDAARLLAHAAWVRRLARTLVADAARRDDADELEQQAWREALERPPRHAEGLRGWWRTVVENVARRRRRAAATRARHELAAGSAPHSSAAPLALATGAAPAAADSVARAELHRRVVDAVLALPEPYRSTLLLRFFDDLPPRAIARRLALPVETIRTRVKRGLERLREGLAAEFDAPARDWRRALLPLTTCGALTMAKGTKLAAAAAIVALGTVATFAPWREQRGAVESGRNASPSEPIVDIATDLAAAARVADPTPTADAEPAADVPTAPLAAPQDELHGRVVDRRGTPVAQALVVAFRSNRNAALEEHELIALLRAFERGEREFGVGVTSGRSADDGTFRFASPAIGGNAFVAAIHAAQGTSGRLLSSPGSLEGRAALDLIVAQPLLLAIRVTDRHEAPIAGALLRLRSAERDSRTSVRSRSFERSCDARGEARLELARPSELTITACAFGFRESSVYDVDVEDRTGEQRVTLVLEAAPRERLAGRLVLRDRSQPVGRWVHQQLLSGELAAALPEGAGIAACPLRQEAFAIAPREIAVTGRLDLDHDRFEIEVDHSAECVALVARRTLLGWITRDAATQQFPVDATIEVDPDRLPSAGADGEVVVRVRAAEEGTPIAPDELDAWIWSLGIEVAVQRSTSQPGDALIDGATLRFIELPRRPLQLGVSAAGREKRFVEVALSPERDLVELDLALERADATLTVTGAGVDALLFYAPSESGWRALAYSATRWRDASGPLVVRNLPRRRLGVLGSRVGGSTSFDEVDLTNGDGALELSASGGEKVVLRLRPAEGFALQKSVASLRLFDRSGRPVIDWQHPGFRQAIASESLFLELPHGTYRGEVFFPEHEPATVEFEVSGPLALEVPLRRRPR